MLKAGCIFKTELAALKWVDQFNNRHALSSAGNTHLQKQGRAFACGNNYML
jgi:hypothetical protein